MNQADIDKVQQMMAPLFRQQSRMLLAAHALQGLVAREEGTVSTEDEEDLAAQAVRLADLTMRGLECVSIP